MPSPAVYIPITDKRNGKQYMMPWSDAVTKPSVDDVQNFINESEAPKGTLSKLADLTTTPLTDFASRNIKKYISEPLLQYSEGQPLNMFGLNLASGVKGPSDGSDIGQTAARYGGAFAQNLGEGLDTLTSPASIATFGAGPAGQGLKMVGGANTVGRLGSVVSNIPRAAGAVMAGSGVKHAYDVSKDPRAGLSDYLGPLTEIGLGGLGAISGGPRAKVEPTADFPAGIASEIPQKQFPEMEPQRQLPPAQRVFYGNASGNPNAPINGLGDLSSGPIVEGSVVREPLALPPARPVATPELNLPQGPLDISSRGLGPVNALARDQAAAARPRPQLNSPLNKFDLTPEGLTQQLGRSKMQAEIDAENAAAGFAPAKPQVTRVPPPNLIDEQGLRSPNSPNRANYSKKALSVIDQETLSNPDLQKDMTLSEIEKLKQGIRTSKTLKQKLAGQSGTIDIQDLMSGFQQGASKVAGKVSSTVGGLRQKGLQNLADAEATGVFGGATKGVSNIRNGIAAVTGPDVTNTGDAVKAFLQSGWGHLESMGEPGQKLSRLLQRERIDVGGELARTNAAGDQLINAKGIPVNRTGGLIWERNKDQIKSLLGQITDPKQQAKATDIVKEFVGQKPDDWKAWRSGVDSIKAIEGATKLSQFSLSNLAGIPSTMLRGDIGATLKNVRRVMPNFMGGDYEAALKEAQSSGFLNKMSSVMQEETGAGGVSKAMNKLFGIGDSESRQRVVATLTGRSTAQDLFDKIKAGSTSKSAMKQLSDLLLEDDMGAVLKQNKLTPKQVLRAGGRMNELTQGFAEGIDLPPTWKSNPAVDLATQFKKMGFVQSRNIKEAFKANPVKTMAVLATAFPIAGEAIGDTKAAIKGTVKGTLGDKDIMDAIREELDGRGNDLGKRYIEDISQAWGLGMLGDAVKGASRGTGGLAKTMIGPAPGDISEAAAGAYDLATKGQGYHLGRQAVRAVPYVGTGLSELIQGDYTGRQPRHQREKRGRN